jgi:glycosyltransferase involved in cell wall biosynthesis
MRALAADLGLTDVVDFTGRISNEHLLAILSTADVGLAPDPKNPLNDISTMNKIVEYMAVGLPIVSYDLLEARVSAGEAAVYATPNEPASFAARLDQLLCDRQRRNYMAAAGPGRLVDHLSWRNSEVALLSAYDRALELRGRASDRTREAQQVGSR